MTDNSALKEHEILDLIIFEDLQSVLEDDFHDLLNEFISSTPPVLNNLNQAISASDFEHIVSISHSLEGSTGNLGINHLSKLLKQIQQTAKSGNIEHCVQLGKDIDVAFDTVKEVLLNKMTQA